MSSLGTTKIVLLGLIAIICVGLLVAAGLFPLLNQDSDNDDDGDTPSSDLNAIPLTTYDEPVVDPVTNSLNGLTEESWFGETIDGDTLNFATDNLGTSEFNSTNDEQRDGILGADGEKNAAPEDSAEFDDSDTGSSEEPREIEEADIIKLEDDTLYILNTYRGLILVDISTPDEPEIKSRIPLFGQPIDMYIVGTRAYVILTHYYNAFLWTEDTSIAPEYRHGSEIVIIDITDHSKPKVQKYIELDGFITDSRRVGNVIYAVVNNYDSYGYIDDIGIGIAIEETEAVMTDSGSDTSGGSGDTEEEVMKEEVVDDDDDEFSDEINGDDEKESITEPQPGTVVISVNFANLDNIVEVDREWFLGSSNQIHVTEDAIFVANPEYNYIRDEVLGYRSEYYTEVTYVDISDPYGEIKIRDTFEVDGFLNDRYQMDYYDTTFRIVTHFWGEWGELGTSKLWTFDLQNPDDIIKMGELLIDDAGNLMATRFAQERAYTIHLPYSIDPLDVIDLSNPYKPVLTDVFEMPGWITHMEVRGLKILALGVDDSDGKRRVAVSIFDVTDPYNADMTDRVIIGEGYSWSSANWDPKALTVVDDQNIVLVPFESYSYDEHGKYESFSGLQLVEFDLDTGDLTAGGAISNVDSVQRTRANEERIFAVSNRQLQVISAMDKAKPKVTATLELCNNIVDVLPMGEYCVQVIPEYNYRESKSETKLRTVSADEPDSMVFLAEQIVDYNIAKIYTNDNYLYLLCSDYSYEDRTTEGRILVYDYSDPTSPVQKSNFLMEYYENSYYWGYYDWYYYPGQSIGDFSFAQVDSDLIVYHPQPKYEYNYYNGEDDLIEIPKEENRTESSETQSDEKSTTTRQYYYKMENITEKLYIIDLSNPDNPEDVSNVTLENTSRISGLHPKGAKLYLTQYEDASYYDEYNRWHYQVKNYINIIDLTTPSEPKPSGTINIPGAFIGANSDGTVIYTRSSEYNEKSEWQQTLNVLELKDEKATLTSVLDLGDTYANIIIFDSTIFISYNEYGWYGYYYEDIEYDGALGAPRDMEYKEPEIKTKIQIIDANDPKNLKLKTTLGLKNYGSIYKVENNKLYLQLSDANGLLIYDLSNLGAPAFKGYFPVQGWINNLRENTSTGKIYLACGWYGVLVIDLA